MRPSNLLALLTSFFLVACTSLAPKFKSNHLFLHSVIPEELCTDEIREYGIYRILEDDSVEILDFCNPLIRMYFGVHSSDIELVEEELATE